MSAAQQVITIDDISADNAPAIYVQDGLKPFLEAVKAEVSGEVPDLASRKGRERIASLAAKVSKSKAAVEKPGRDYLRRLKEMPKVVEAELRVFVTEMDALRDQVRQPLTDWQAAEDARVDRHEFRIQQLRDLVDVETLFAEGIRFKITNVESVIVDAGFEEFEAEAHRVKATTLASLRESLARQEKYEADQAELDRLRAEAEERAKADREAAIAKEAAERAMREAEQKAQAEREAVARREREAAEAAERRELELKLQAEQSARAAERAEADRLAAEQELINAVQRADVAAEQARIEERRRAEAEAAEVARQQAAREADRAHKGAIYKAAKEAFMTNGVDEETARMAVKLIASGLIPHIKITY